MKKKVLLIATVQSHIAQFHKPLMKLLKENAWEIHVAARDNLLEKNGLKLDYPDKVFNVLFQRSPFDKRNITAYNQLKKILKDEHYSVIHCNTPVGGVVGRLAGRKYRKDGTQIFYTAHGFHFYNGAPRKNWIIYYPIEKWMSRYTDKLITITEEDYKLAKEKFNCGVCHIHGVGANSEKYFPLTIEEQKRRKKKLGIERQKILMNVGELLPNKNHKTAILAMREIVEHFSDAHLYIAGNGPDREMLQALIKEQGLESIVTFLGYTTQLQEYMQVCDAELACSYREGLPLNVLEAMMCGKPVVASHNRGHNELVKDDITGYLVQADDIHGFAEATCKILDNPLVYKEAALITAEKYKDYMVQNELKEIYQL